MVFHLVHNNKAEFTPPQSAVAAAEPSWCRTGHHGGCVYILLNQNQSRRQTLPVNWALQYVSAEASLASSSIAFLFSVIYQLFGTMEGALHPDTHVHALTTSIHAYMYRPSIRLSCFLLWVSLTAMGS